MWLARQLSLSGSDLELPLRSSEIQSSEIQLFLLYHSCQSARRMQVDRLASKLFKVHTVGLSAGLAPDCTARLPSNLTIADLAPFYRTSLGQQYLSLLAENAAIIALGLRITTLLSPSCRERRCWVGSASWKVVADSTKLFDPACQNLESIARRLRPAELEQLPERATLYWWGERQLVRWKSDVSRHARRTDRELHKSTILQPFFEWLGVSYEAAAASIRADGPPLPWANWWLAPPDVAADLAKLHLLLYSWLEARWPMREVGCNGTVWRDNPQRCWAYAGEELTLLFLVSETNLHHLRCAGPPAPFHSSSTWLGGSPGTLTERARERWLTLNDN